MEDPNIEDPGTEGPDMDGLDMGDPDVEEPSVEEPSVEEPDVHLLLLNSGFWGVVAELDAGLNEGVLDDVDGTLVGTGLVGAVGAVNSVRGKVGSEGIELDKGPVLALSNSGSSVLGCIIKVEY